MGQYLKLITIFLIAFLIIGNLRVSIKPFSIALPNWRAATGIVMILIGVTIYHNAGYRKGWNEAIDKVKEVIDKLKSEKQKAADSDSV